METVATATPEVQNASVTEQTSQPLIGVYNVFFCVFRLSVLQDQVVLTVRQQYVAISDQVVTLGDGDEVAVVPPLSGG